LDFVPQLGASIPIVARHFARSLAAYEREHGRPLDLHDYFWRPPLTAGAVIASECRHIEDRFECAALVSLTDHDTMEGPRRLRAEGHDEVPLSVEWSVPFEGTIYHLGIHAIRASQVHEAAGGLSRGSWAG
jgi:hypothetical protein